MLMLTSPLSAETLTCENPLVSVTSQQAKHAEIACETVNQAIAQFEQCNMPSLSKPLDIHIVEEIEDGCVGLYHCGKGLIEVLAPSSMASQLDPNGAFAFLPISGFFRSAIVHELAHAVSDGSPCPFEACLVRDEYLAYAMQVMSLTSDEQLKFSAIAGLDRTVSRDELSSIGLFMAPNLFSQKVWTHLNQRDDPCGFIGQLSQGKILLDRERF